MTEFTDGTKLRWLACLLVLELFRWELDPVTSTFLQNEKVITISVEKANEQQHMLLRSFIELVVHILIIP